MESEDGSGPDYRQETARLASFSHWSRCPVVPVDRLARAGFYATGSADTVACFHCGVQVANWRFGHEAARRHLELSPDCAFIQGSSDCGNVPASSIDYRRLALQSRLSAGSDADTPSSERQSPQRQHPSERENRVLPSSPESDSPQWGSWRERLKSYERNWPKENIISGESLARAGFFYSGRSDVTVCVCCGGRLQQWVRGDDPLAEHLAHFPRCSLAQSLSAHRSAVAAQSHGTSNIGLNTMPTPAEESQRMPETPELRLKRELARLGIFQGCPKNEHMATLSSRLSSFNGWPPTAAQRPLHLASAGFFFTGVEDKVKCFHCDGGLHNWLPTDSVYREHAKWFPHCEYILLLKGADYVRETAVLEMPGQRKRAVTQQSHGEVDFSVLADNGVELSGEVIRAAQEMGFTEAEIGRAVIGNGWKGFQEADSLLETLLKARAAEAVPDVGSPSKSDASELELEDGGKSETANGFSMEMELAILREQRRCKICMDSEACVVLVPCGHLCSCATCVPALKDCPICREPIQGRLKAYFS